MALGTILISVALGPGDIALGPKDIGRYPGSVGVTLRMSFHVACLSDGTRRERVGWFHGRFGCREVCTYAEKQIQKMTKHRLLRLHHISSLAGAFGPPVDFMCYSFETARSFVALHGIVIYGSLFPCYIVIYHVFVVTNLHLCVVWAWSLDNMMSPH